MIPRARSAQPEDYPWIYRFVFESFKITGVENQTKAEWEAFESARKNQGLVILGIIVEDATDPVNPVPVAYQQVRFVSSAFVKQFRTEMPGWLLVEGRKCIDAGVLPGLSEAELLAANETDGVHLVIDYYGWDRTLSDDDAASARDYLYRAFQLLCRGYNLKSMLIETIGESSEGTLLAKNAGFQTVRKHQDGPIFHEVTDDQALRGVAIGTLVAPLFAGGKPHLNFSFFDRCLILAALWGYSDADLAREWCRSEDAIGGYWRKIYQKVKRDFPTLLPTSDGEADSQRSGGRGKERKEPLLNFIRDNPHELGPILYLPPEWRDPPREPSKRRTR